jgi:hypothetical protein
MREYEHSIAFPFPRETKLENKKQKYNVLAVKIFLTYQKHPQCWIVFVNIAASLLSCFSAKQIEINCC